MKPFLGALDFSPYVKKKKPKPNKTSTDKEKKIRNMGKKYHRSYDLKNIIHTHTLTQQKKLYYSYRLKFETTLGLLRPRADIFYIEKS